MSGIFSQLERVPDDSILGINELFKTDKRPGKVNVSIGCYLNDDGRMPLFAAVAEAEKRINARREPRGYCPMQGLAGYRAAARALVFGADHEGVVRNRIHTHQTLGGTGALHLAAALAHDRLGITKCVVSDPTWANHIAIMKRSGLEVGKYAYYDRRTGGLDFEGMTAALSRLEPKTLVLLHACCHNPTGVSLSREQWNEVLRIVQQRGLVPLLDIAYQGYGKGLDEDAYAPRLFASAGVPLFVASSNSKNFALYGERIGALHVVTESEKEADITRTVLNAIVRMEYSNPALHGAALVAEVLGDRELTESWKNELAAECRRVRLMREKLAEAGARLGIDLSYVTRHEGMFSFTGLSADQIAEMREKYAVYGVANGRICLAALTSSGVEACAKAIAAVSKKA